MLGMGLGSPSTTTQDLPERIKLYLHMKQGMHILEGADREGRHRRLLPDACRSITARVRAVSPVVQALQNRRAPCVSLRARVLCYLSSVGLGLGLG